MSLREPRSTVRKQLAATATVFFILGAVVATWASRIPAIWDLSNLTAVTLGYVLLGKGIGSLSIMPVVAITLGKWGAKNSTILFGFILISTLIPMTMAPDWIFLTAVLFICGAGIGGFNVSINALASQLEVSTGRSHMSLVHAFFGVGNFAGALIGTGMAGFVSSLAGHFWGIAAVLTVVLLLVSRFLPDETEKPPVRTGFKLPHGAVLWLGVICFLAASIEDSISNWVGLFFSDHLGAPERLVPVGYTVYAGSLLAMRLVGDRLKPRFGAKNLLVSGSVVSSLGIISAIFAPNVVVGILGFITAGAGVALVFPMILSVAGKQGAVALASVMTMGSIGGLISQPVMGVLVEHFELTGGFTFILACMLAVGFTSRKSKLLND